MKVTVDFDVCASTGSCVQVCPEVFEIKSDGYLNLKIDGELPTELEEKAVNAADLCPTAAITIVE